MTSERPHSHVGLGLVVIGALALAGCSSGAVPTTTTSTTVRATSAGAVARFLAEAHLGNNQTFVASYRYIGRDNGPRSIEFAQQPRGPGSEEPFQAGDFVYIARQDGQTHEFIQRDHGDYMCFRTGRGPWSCEGPNPNISNGNILQTEGFDVQSALAQNEPTPPPNATISSRTVNGLKVTCLVRYRRLRQQKQPFRPQDAL